MEFVMKFKNATIVKKANIFFDGKVTSRTIFLEDGSRKTLGIMLQGEYSFNTQEQELMEVLAGSMDIMLAGETSYHTYKEGESFTVPAQSSFKLIIKQPADYCCSYQA